MQSGGLPSVQASKMIRIKRLKNLFKDFATISARKLKRPLITSGPYFYTRFYPGSVLIDDLHWDFLQSLVPDPWLSVCVVSDSACPGYVKDELSYN